MKNEYKNLSAESVEDRLAQIQFEELKADLDRAMQRVPIDWEDTEFDQTIGYATKTN